MINFIISSLRLHWLKKKADIGKSLTKRPHYVIKWNGKLQVVSSKNIRQMKDLGILSKKVTWLKLQEMAVYKTN